MAYPYNLSEILELMGYTESDFYVEDHLDGNGPLISNWNHTDSQPTDDTVVAFYNNYLSHDDRLIEKKYIAKKRIDVAAEHARRRYLSFGSGQAMSYLRKEEDAQKYKDAGYPAIGSPNEYPWITAEVDATSLSAQVTADNILTQRDAWITIGTTIEKERRIGKIAIDASSDETNVTIVQDSTISILDAI